MTTDRSRVTDALIARALTERAGGPDANLLAPIMAEVSAAQQRGGWALRLGLSHRTVMLGLAAVALAGSLVAAAIVGSMFVRPTRFVERPLPENGPITVQLDGGLVEVDPQSGRTLADVALPPAMMGSVGDLAWSPDGSRLAVSTDRGLSILDIATGQTSSPMTCVFCPVAWSPDGTELAVVDAAQVIVLIDPRDGHRISQIEPDARKFEAGVTWSPDGRRLAYVEFDAVTRTRSVSIIERDGTNKRTLALPTRGDMILDISWSPDGATIAYIGNAVPFEDAAQPLDLVLLDPEGVRPGRVIQVGECFCLGFSPGLTWSPDGRHLAYNSLTGVAEGGTLFVANADGTDPTAIASGASGTIAWRPIPASPPD
jgi:Tol biopolymer transport system component